MGFDYRVVNYAESPREFETLMKISQSSYQPAEFVVIQRRPDNDHLSCRKCANPKHRGELDENFEKALIRDFAIASITRSERCIDTAKSSMRPRDDKCVFLSRRANFHVR